MSLAVTLLDETTTGKVVNQTTLKLVSERISVRDLISQRIREEVEKFNRQKKLDIFSGLVQPSDTEKTLNGYKMKKPKLIDVDKQIDLALTAFESNGFFLLVDDRQVEELDEMLTLRENSMVSFVKLVPLVGG